MITYSLTYYFILSDLSYSHYCYFFGMPSIQIPTHLLKQYITTLHHTSKSRLPEPPPPPKLLRRFLFLFRMTLPFHPFHPFHPFDPNFIPFFECVVPVENPPTWKLRGSRVGGLRKRRANFEARKGGATTESPVTMEAIELCFGEEIEEVARPVGWV